MRYEKSFWRALFLEIDRELGSKPRVLKNSSKIQNQVQKHERRGFPERASFQKYRAYGRKFTQVFRPLGKELEEVRHGLLSEKLHYEFSFWSDLAKHLLLVQENELPYEVNFFLPSKLEIDTSDLHLSLPLKKIFCSS